MITNFLKTVFTLSMDFCLAHVEYQGLYLPDAYKKDLIP